MFSNSYNALQARKVSGTQPEQKIFSQDNKGEELAFTESTASELHGHFPESEQSDINYASRVSSRRVRDLKNEQINPG